MESLKLGEHSRVTTNKVELSLTNPKVSMVQSPEGKIFRAETVQALDYVESSYSF